MRSQRLADTNEQRREEFLPRWRREIDERERAAKVEAENGTLAAEEMTCVVPDVWSPTVYPS